MLQGLNYCLVLDRRSDDVTTSGLLAVGSKAQQGDVVALGSPTSEDQLVGFGVDCAGEVLARLLYRALRTGPILVRSRPGVPEVLGHPVHHHVGHTRVHACRSRNIEIGHHEPHHTSER